VSKPPEISRRAFVLGTTASVAISAAGALTAPGDGASGATPLAAGTAAGNGADLCNLSAVAAVEHMTQGALTSERYAQALLERCQRAHGLNAFISLQPARVLEDARARDRERLAGTKSGPLFGLPIPVKDSVNTRDYPTTGGTPALRQFRPKDDAPLVTALRAAGAVVLGKTNLHELSYGWSAFPAAAAAEPRPQSPRVWRRSALPKTPKVPSACPRRFAGWPVFAPPRDAIRREAACRSRRCSIRQVRTHAASRISPCSIRWRPTIGSA
jgi:hypothetical protein